ncbi:MAG: hypothetical protein AABX88_01765 [Nanoarchaeota archaeon]
MSNYKTKEKERILNLLNEHFDNEVIVKLSLKAVLNNKNDSRISQFDIDLSWGSYDLLHEVFTSTKKYNEDYSDLKMQEVEKETRSCLAGSREILENLISALEIKKLREKKQ